MPTLEGQKIYKCPGDKGKDTLFKRVRTRSYGLNAFMNDVDQGGLEGAHRAIDILPKDRI